MQCALLLVVLLALLGGSQGAKGGVRGAGVLRCVLYTLSNFSLLQFKGHTEKSIIVSWALEDPFLPTL